ncbi:hypothetical protein [Methanopyrus sp.]
MPHLPSQGWQGCAAVGALRTWATCYGPLPHGWVEFRKFAILVRYRWEGDRLVYRVDELPVGFRWEYGGMLLPIKRPVPRPFEEPGGSYSGEVRVTRGEVEPVGAFWVWDRPVPVIAVRSREGVRLLVLSESSTRVFDLGPVMGPIVLTHSLREERYIEGQGEITVPPARVLFVDDDGNLVELDPASGSRTVAVTLSRSARVWGWLAGGYLVTDSGRTLLVTPTGELREIEVPEGWRVFSLPENDYVRKYGLLVLASDEGLAVGRLVGPRVRIFTPILKVPTDVRLVLLTHWHWPDFSACWKWNEPVRTDPGGVLLVLSHGDELIVAAWHAGVLGRGSWKVKRVRLPGNVVAAEGVAVGACDFYDARSMTLAFVPDGGHLKVYRVIANVVPRSLIEKFALPVPPAPVRRRRRTVPRRPSGGNSTRRDPM